MTTNPANARIIKVCIECKNDYSTTANNYLRSHRCPCCQQMRENNARNRKHKRAYQTDQHTLAYRLLICPDDLFPPGASFTAEEFNDTLRMGHFTPGTMFEHRLMRGREIVKIVGAECKGQRAIRLKKEELT